MRLLLIGFYSFLFLFLITGVLSGVTGYQKSPHVPKEIWDELAPHFLPADHPIKKRLDKIFTKSRVTENLQTMKAAGFKLTETQGQSVHATKHALLPGYVIKMYPENVKTKQAWDSWKSRLTGAALLKEQIVRHKCGKLFKVANKWVYPIPQNPPLSEKPGYHRKNFILVVEDMGILRRKANHRTWRELMKKGVLKKLVAITRPIGARDCARADNIPWCSDGRIAFVDTESYHTWPINYHGLLEHLNKSMRKWWEPYYQDKEYAP